MKRKIIGIILIFGGIAIIITAFGLRFYANYRQGKLLKDFENTIISIGEEASTPSPFPEVTEINSTAAKGTPMQGSKGTIGIMEIPKISLKICLSEGTDEETLKYGVGHFKGTAMPGEKGNSAFAGHRNYVYNQYFNRLDELTINDEIKIITKKGTFKYKIYEKEVVLPTEISVLNPTKEATVTLVTCTPIKVSTHRLIIKGKLEE